MAAMKLEKIRSIAIVPTAPFAFDATFHKPDHFTSGDNYWEPGVRWQTWNWQGRQLGLKFVGCGSTEEPKIMVEIYYQSPLEDGFINSLIDEVRYRYNVDLDLAEFYAVFANDQVLSPIIKRWRGMRPGHQGSLYEYLIIGIVLQNATVRRSVQMFQALLEHYGTLLDFDGKKLWCFWEPGSLQHITENELRALKVGYRARAVKRIDDQFAQGLLDEYELRGKDRETQRKALLTLYGVGPATVWYLLFDVFHHWDFYDHISPWEQKIYSKLFFDVDPEKPVAVQQLLEYFEKYGEYKQLAVHYIWEDLWWRRKHEGVPWLEKLVRV